MTTTTAPIVMLKGDSLVEFVNEKMELINRNEMSRTEMIKDAAMISNTCYEIINTSCDLLSYWKRYLGTTDSPVLEYVCPRFEYAENLKDYYRYVAWAEDYNQTEENY